ncbi:MAG: hypothetical protein WBW84_07795, partial [Acidobacteriaceae bacterium]
MYYFGYPGLFPRKPFYLSCTTQRKCKTRYCGDTFVREDDFGVTGGWGALRGGGADKGKGGSPEDFRP